MGWLLSSCVFHCYLPHAYSYIHRSKASYSLYKSKPIIKELRTVSLELRLLTYDK
nr:MAG TPA: hypothetical protein [Caudoviricetes sp.]